MARSLKLFASAASVYLALVGCTDKRSGCELSGTCTSEVILRGGTGGMPGEAIAGAAGTTWIETSVAGAPSTSGGTAGAAGTEGVSGDPCDGTCSDATPVCHPTKVQCVTCLSDVDCKSTPETPACTYTNQCVECLTDTHCSGPLPHCTGDLKCAECVRDAHCAAPTPACTGTLKCVECTQNKHCAAPTPICVGLKCVECSQNQHCSGATPYCNMATWKCVGCRGGSECDPASATPVCNVTKQICVPCLYNSECKTAPASRCDSTTNTCLPCQSEYDCYQVTGKPACLIGAGGAGGASGQPNRCVQCTAMNQSQCGNKGCNVATNTCNL